MPDINIVKIDGKPLEKLIETVSAGIGTLYKPRAIRKEAEAKAYEVEVLANAKAKATIIKSESDSEIAERARQRLYYQEMNRQINIDVIVDKAVGYLNETVAEQAVDENWRTRFFNKVQDISLEELQEVWAKILANEINKPGSVHLRTLDILSNMSAKDAKLFAKLCALSTVNGHILKLESDLKSFGLSFENIMTLMDAGLLLNNLSLTSDIEDFELITWREKKGLLLKWNNLELFITNKPKPRVSFGKKLLLGTKYPDGENKKYFFSSYILTPAGNDLHQIVNSKIDLEYIKKLKETLDKAGYIVEEFN